MPQSSPAGSGGPREGAHAALSGAALFALVWDALADVLGTAATATLVRRAARRAQPTCLELAALVVVREDLEYRYTVPSTWREDECDLSPLRELVRELVPLLVEMTGQVVTRRLERIPELRAREIILPQGGPI